jgi:hypothetical protein
MELELRIDGQTVIKADVTPDLLNLIRGTAPHREVARSTPLTVPQVQELLSRIDARSVAFLKQLAANDGIMTWGDARPLFGITNHDDWSGYAQSFGRGITRAVRNVTGDSNARLVWWDDRDKRWGGPDMDAALLFIDGPALEALRQVTAGQ